MPWSVVKQMDSKIQFLGEYLKNEKSITELCKKHNISRPTAYKVINRYNQEGINGLDERSKAHINHPSVTPEAVQSFLLEVKGKYPTWGPKKIKQFLKIEYPDKKWPAASTIGDIFKKNGLVIPAKKRPNLVTPYTRPFEECNQPNDVWSADYKGNFYLKNNNGSCYPLTITDNFSRFIIDCVSLSSPNLKETMKVFEKVFNTYGLPKAIRTDNGTPFASSSIMGLSTLSILFIKLGVTLERIQKGHPEQNGRHERMHRTLKAEATIPPCSSHTAQQERFNQFMDNYNNIRPHAALDGKRPSDLYTPSIRPYTGIKPAEYNKNMRILKVRHKGDIKFANRQFYIGSVLSGELLGLQEVDDNKWVVFFYNLMLGTIDRTTKSLHKF